MQLWAETIAQLVDYCPRVYKALGSITSTALTRCGGICLESPHLGGVSMGLRSTRSCQLYRQLEAGLG